MADLDPELDALRRAAAGGVPMVDLDVVAIRERVTAGNRLCDDGPSVHVTDLPSGRNEAPVPLRVYEGEEATTTLVYAHGGGWVTGDLDYSDELCRYLAHTSGVRVVSVDYRLAPEHPFPAGLEDVTAAWHWVGDRYAGPLALGGDSAGGNLAAALAQRLARNGIAPPPAFLLLIYAVLGLPDETVSYRTNEHAFPIGAADLRWFFQHYARGNASHGPTPDLAPLHASDLSGLPRTHVVVAGHDPLYDEGRAFATALADARVPVTLATHDDLCHGFLRFTTVSNAAREARSSVVTVVRQLATSGVETSRTHQIHAYDSPVTESRPPVHGETMRKSG